MEFKTDDEVIKFLEDNITTPNWVGVSRKKSEELKALVSGKNFDKLLIEKIDHIESADRAAARTKYAKDIRSVFERINQPRINVFSASGGEIVNKIKSNGVSIRNFTIIEGEVLGLLTFFSFGTLKKTQIIVVQYFSLLSQWAENPLKFWYQMVEASVFRYAEYFIAKQMGSIDERLPALDIFYLELETDRSLKRR